MVDHDRRYEIAAEFVEVVQGLWDSWEDGARIENKETGQYYDLSKVHELGHKGQFYSVKGPLNITRTPQGRPVIVQAGSSPAGQALAGRIAEVVFTVQLELDVAREYYQNIKRYAVAAGRRPEHCNILPGMVRSSVERTKRLKPNSRSS